MIVGFTGTQDGMTDAQKEQVRDWLQSLDVTEFHHGDCIGADEEAHEIAKSLGIRTVAHPGHDARGDSPKRANQGRGCDTDEVREPKPYRARNQDMVGEVDVLIGASGQSSEVQRSGTWMTIRMARKSDTSHLVVYPSGEAEVGRERDA